MSRAAEQALLGLIDILANRLDDLEQRFTEHRHEISPQLFVPRFGLRRAHTNGPSAPITEPADREPGPTA